MSDKTLTVVFAGGKEEQYTYQELRTDADRLSVTGDFGWLADTEQQCEDVPEVGRIVIPLTNVLYYFISEPVHEVKEYDPDDKDSQDPSKPHEFTDLESQDGLCDWCGLKPKHKIHDPGARGQA